jgi:hypothetical protein
MALWFLIFVYACLKRMPSADRSATEVPLG